MRRVSTDDIEAHDSRSPIVRTCAALADSVVRVPIYGRAESLNLATAAAVCLYATARVQRQRRSDR